MTTNVLDLLHDIAATDSRWSIDTPDFIVFIDDNGFEKIKEKYRYLSVFAGNANLIQRFKDWIDTDGEVPKPTDDEIEGMVAITITDTDSGVVLFERTQAHPLPEARFAGTGATHAMMCWMKNGCAKTAVSSAIVTDKYSGGEIKYYSFDGANNLSGNWRYEMLVKAIAEDGMVMYKQKIEKAVPIKEAAAVDPQVKAIIDGIAAGKVQPCAPCAEMHLPWTADEKRRLDRALNLIIRPR